MPRSRANSCRIAPSLRGFGQEESTRKEETAVPPVEPWVSEEDLAVEDQVSPATQAGKS